MTKNDFESYIAGYLKDQRESLIREAMAYAMEGGKRFRPRIVFAIAKGFGMAEEKTYPAALALEMIQTYSLIHDDLPAMDDDDFRRGKPSLHKAFREDIAILTGDALLTDAFRVLATASYTDEVKAKIIAAFGSYAGMDGMIYGQLLDVTADETSIDLAKLQEIQENKTGGLFKIACLIPMYLKGIDDEKYHISLGSLIGRIFQNQDDLFDLIRTKEEMGKEPSDIKNQKGTALSLYTVKELQDLIDEEFRELDELLKGAQFDTEELKELLKLLRER